MPCVFGKNEPKVVIQRKVLILKRRPKNPNDKRILNVYYIPINKDLANFLHLDQESYIKAEIAKVPQPD